MPTTLGFLSEDGDKRFFKATSRIFHSRNNHRLLLIDETLKDYVKLQPTDPVAKLKVLLALNVRIDNYMNEHKDRTSAQKHGFRLPVVEQLKKEVQDAIDKCPQPVPQPPQQPAIAPPPPPQPQGPVHNAVRAQTNWGLLRSGVQQVIPQGSIPKGTDASGIRPRHLAVEDGVSNNWLEVLHKEHVRGDQLFQHFTTWKAQFSTTMPFRDYLGQLDPKTREALTECSVYYVHDLVARALFEAFFEGGRLKSRMTPELQDEIVKTQGTADARQHIRELASEHREPRVVDSTEWPALGFVSSGGKGWVCFVLSLYNTLYIGKHVSRQFHHSSLLAGAPIVAAGMLRIVNGEITEIEGKNGHYRADSADLKKFVQFLKNQGIDLTRIRVIPFYGDPVTADSFLDGTDKPFNFSTEEYGNMEDITGISNVAPKPKPPKPITAVPRVVANNPPPQPPPDASPKLLRKYV